ncbi:calmin-like [Sinocyclocheilus anshuiensis]|uniref:Calmin n=1 Tax=Sinocyclocheilus anshuiensis TaxID=1608454 RepID=A0A671L8J4_9TELE|nr:PREDICTED: calmin-like [Sinocyclocheilus anshuiensis]XP_016347862.1 PREDICTED: calmin-like [Sinocyclocheilus anshuiensis]
MNLHLEKCNPRMEVRDLFCDIQDGKILMALLEELSGCKLLHGFKPSSHRIFRLNNIAKVLTFLEERNVKLVSIDAADIADGNPSIVLGLIWNIILFFQIKELTGNIKSQFPSSSSLSSIPTSSDSDTSHSSTPSDDRKPTIAPRGHGRVIKTLLQWVQRRTRKYGVAVQDFGKSWTSGLAFLAVIKSIDTSLVDMRRALLRTPRENIEEAFRTAHYSLGIPRLLEPEDVMLNPPDEQSIMTYVSQFLEHFPGIEEAVTSDILERNKAGARMNEPPVRNGVQRKWESYTVKKDVVQLPPKIFISSVSEDREQITSPVLPQTPEDKPWTSEGSSVGSSPSPAIDKPLLDLNADVSTTSSPQPSFSSDSAVNSPDSWSEVLSETTNSHRINEDPIIESSTAGTVEVTSDLGSPFSPESTPENHLDRVLFIDEGNYSLGSMDSLHAKSTAPSEEDDAYKYILDLKEEQSANHLPSEDMRNKSECLEQTQTNPLEHQEQVKPSSDDSSCLESDSGYFQDNKEAMTAQPEDESLLTSTVDEEVSGVLESEAFQDNVESSNTEAMQRDTLDLTDGPEEKHFIFEDDSEPECPVLQYKRVSISGSEEDIKLCADLAEEPTEEPGKNLPNGHSETNENSDLRNGEQEAVLESEVKDVVFEEPEEPISDWSQTEVEIPDEDQVCYMCGGPVAKSSAESSEQGDDCLSHLNSTEKDCNSDSRHFSESEGNFEDNPREKNNELNGTVSDLKNEPRESKGIHEDLLIIGKSHLESGSDGIRRTEFSHNTNSESQAQVSDNMEPGGAKDNRPVSVVDSHYDVLNSVTETFVEPLSDTSIHDGENDSTPSQSLHRLHPEVYCTELPIEEETTFEDSKFIIGVRGYSERRPAELRLSLSMTPLEPAPPKRSLTESDTDTEDTSEDHGKGFKSRKDRAGSMHIQEQSPFDRHPGEWGAVEPDSPVEHCELIKTDDDLTISAGARENTGAMREGAVTDASQPLTTIHLRKVIDITESKGQNGKALDRSKVDSTIINKSSESKTAASPESTYDTTLSDLVYIILAAWLFVYCLLVLPQIDLRTLPKLLFNTDE